MKNILPILFSLLSFSAFASHERAGEITYKWLGGYTYSITVTTYTKASSCGADKCSLEINFGDDTSHYPIYRHNGPPCQLPGVICQTGPMPNCSYCGQLIGLSSDDIKMNRYDTVWTYPGPGVYIISMTDPNRNADIVNIPSNNTAFSIQDTIKIYSATPGMPPYNNSAILTNPPIDKACIGKIFVHNPGAVDPDGDSLSYKLGVCFEDVGTPIGGYYIPTGVSVDPITGDFIWISPSPGPLPSACHEYNFAIDIQEWALNTENKKRYLIGTVRRDMQVNVCNCNNNPPVISNLNDACIEAGSNLTLTVIATDPDNDMIQTFTAAGAPFIASPAATFISDAPVQSPSTGTFSWTPDCNKVRLQPHLVTFKATDDGGSDQPPVTLTDYETFFIRVIAPAPKNLTAFAQCTSIKLEWDTAFCNPAGNPLFKYKIYRKIGCDTLQPGYCETGMPSNWGYTLIATISSTTATPTYTDTNGGNGLVHGNLYAYRVVAYYLDGSESYVSDPICAKLVRDVPVITNVDVISTGTTNGSIDVKWIKPIADAANFDTLLAGNEGPYGFKLYRSIGFTNPTTLLASFSSPYFATLNNTSFSDTPINTASTPFSYKVEFYSASNSICPTQRASSIFLSCTPGDNKIQITWDKQVPWTNTQYDVYRFNSITTAWDSIGTTALQTFTDTGLANGANYCYKVKSTGAYPDTSIPSPLINWSQELCCSPVDLTPPCANILAVDSSCDLSRNLLTWTNPNNSCSNDALYYIIYHNDSLTGEYFVLDTIPDINTTFFLDDSLSSIAGCYAVTSVDSFANESAYSNIVCIDNCPYYQLPNVFTPNEDGSNDFFMPLHPYKYVKDISIKIYNRWGFEVFRTTDPEILWDGKSAQTKMMCADGVYYYVCIVNDIRLKGIVPHALTGYVHLMMNK